MSITSYVGLPGAGKSYEVVNGPILAAVNVGRVVWTNIPVKIDGVTVIEGARSQEHWYLDAPHGALIVVDECWRFWPAGMKADAIPEAQKEFFAMHRHRTKDGKSTDIILVTQDLSQVASFVRGLIEKTVKMTKLIALGSRSRYRVDIYDGAVTGQKPPKARHIGGSIRKYKPEGFARYQSHTQGGAAVEVTVDQRGNVFKSATVIVIPLAVVAMLMLPAMVGKVASKGHEAPKEKPAKETKAAKPAQATERSDRAAPQAAAYDPDPADLAALQPPDAPPPPPAESRRWTMLGVISKQDGTGIAILESATGRRRVDLQGCEYARDLAQWTCNVDGEVVSFWTGNGSLRLAQGATYTARSDQ